MTGIRERGLLWPTLAALAVLLVLLSLGTWQWQRKLWKEGLIRQIAERTRAEPISLAEAARRGRAGENIEYLRVRATGRYQHASEVLLWAPGSAGPGWHVYTPLVTEAGPIVIVNRGFVADADRDRRRRLEPEGHPLTVVGPIRRPEVKALFTPANDPERNAWYWRDLDGMALAMLGAAGPGKVQPFFLEAEARPPADIAAEPHHPRGGATRLELPNNHLQYALTWYGLALTLVGVYAAFAWPRLAGIRKDVAGPP